MLFCIVLLPWSAAGNTDAAVPVITAWLLFCFIILPCAGLWQSFLPLVSTNPPASCVIASRVLLDMSFSICRRFYTTELYAKWLDDPLRSMVSQSCHRCQTDGRTVIGHQTPEMSKWFCYHVQRSGQTTMQICIIETITTGMAEWQIKWCCQDQQHRTRR